MPRRGAEIGGLLISSSTDPTSPIDEIALIPSEHRYGPGYHLSPRDLALVRTTAADTRQQKGRRVAGFFRSCTSEQFDFSPNDLDVLREELPESGVLLIVKPFADGHSTARVYQQRDGAWCQTAEFPITPARAAVRPVKVRTAPKPLLALPPLQPPAKKTPTRPRLWVYSLAGCLALLAAIAFLGPRPAESITLGLNVSPEGDLVRVTWNRNAAPIRSGAGGVLRIDEGGQHRDIALNAGQLASGAVLYRTDSRDVTFRLAVNGKAHAEETIRYVTGGTVSPPRTTAPPVTPAEISKAPAPVAPPRAKEPAEIKPVKNREPRASGVIVQSAPQTPVSQAHRATPEPIPPSKTADAPVKQPDVPQVSKLAEQAAAAPSPVQPASQPVSRPPAPESQSWEPVKSVMHYFNDPAVIHPTPVREVRPKPKGGMPSQPVEVRVLVAVDDRGGVSGAHAVDPPASAREDLIGEAVAAARHWKFEPARDHGKKVAGTYTITFRFPTDNH